MATVTGNAAIEQADHGHHDSEDNVDNRSSQAQMAYHGVNLNVLVFRLPLIQLSQPQEKGFLKSIAFIHSELMAIFMSYLD